MEWRAWGPGQLDNVSQVEFLSDVNCVPVEGKSGQGESSWST